MRELAGNRVLITGASSGVGAAAARSFAAAGCDCALMARGVDGLEETAKTVRSEGRHAVVTPADLSDRDAVARAVAAAVEELGGLDVLVLNAAITVFGPFQEVDPDDFDRVVEVTFLGTVNVVREALPALEASAGAIVATGSLMTKVPLPTFSSYAAAKHAERGFLNSLRVELEATGSDVTVSMLHPGAINTPVWENTPSATGFLPRRPPEGYAASDVAAALVDLAQDPRPEITFGAEAKAIEWLFERTRPAGELLLSIVHHYYLSGRRPATSNLDALWQSVGKGVVANGLIQRPSLTMPLRMATLPFRVVTRR